MQRKLMERPINPIFQHGGKYTDLWTPFIEDSIAWSRYHGHWRTLFCAYGERQCKWLTKKIESLGYECKFLDITGMGTRYWLEVLL